MIYPLSEGVFTIGHDKIFVPFDHQKDVLNQRPQGSLLVEIQPFLILWGDKKIILDTGLGFMQNGILQIHRLLQQKNIQPEEINWVLLSHLHKDHAGGICYTDDNGIEKLTFPNARYVVNKNEFDYAMQHHGLSYTKEDFEILANNAQTEWISGDGKLQDWLVYTEDGGHCPYHTSFLLETNEKKIFFGGDVAPQLKQLKYRYMAKYDFDGKKSMQLREEYAQRGKEEQWDFLFYHDVKTPMAVL